MIDCRPVPPSNYLRGRQGRPITHIVMHHMAGTAQGADARFKNPTARVSAHYGILRSAEVWQWVDEADAAYHAGHFDMNLGSIGIEHEDNAADDYIPAQLEASAALIADLWRRHGTLTVIRHRDVVPTACPGTLPVEDIVARALEIGGGDMTPDEVNALIKRYLDNVYGPALEAELVQRLSDDDDAVTKAAVAAAVKAVATKLSA